MDMKASLKAALIAALPWAACAAPDPFAPADHAGVGVAAGAWCQGYYVDNVVAEDGVVFWVSPNALAVAADAWGPQLLSLSVDQGFSPQVTYQELPSVSVDDDKITTSLQKALSFSLTTSVDLTAETSVAVPTDAYYRVEAYPEYQVVDFDVQVDPCGPSPATFVTPGSVYRPVGVYFMVMDFVSGAWNALSPPSPSEIPDPMLAGDAGADGGDAGI
jgi:hypothetical protein